ncbi:hypothetical protein [Demequina sp.]|uniref:hypothetical protein n=1 Tax=Demequina sp. TaxID=2050685 RepID=UPI003A86C1CA
MFSSMVGPLSGIVVLAVLVMVVALLAEGRGRHLARLVLGLRPRRTADEILDDVPRQEVDWSLVSQVASVPDRPAPGTRAVTWAADATVHAIDAVQAKANELKEQREQVSESPRTGELGLVRQ